MKYKYLRSFMKRKNLSRPYEHANKALIIDGLCFRELYKMSGCPFILGGEYDRYAASVKNLLSTYIKCDIECYVVFNGAGKSDMGTRKYVHQKIIDKTDAIIPGGTYEYCEPIFVKEVYKDILNEFQIKHFTCTYDSKEAIFSLAKKLKCPILSPCIEYALYGVSVIPFRSVVFDEEKQSIKGSIYFDRLCRRWLPLSDDLICVLLAIADEDSKFYNELLNMFSCRPDNYIASVVFWIRRQSFITAMKNLKSHIAEENGQVLLDTVTELKRLFHSSHSLAVDTLVYGRQKENRKDALGNMSDALFQYNVGIGKIAQPFINLKTIGTLSGSWVVYNKNREDAMLVVTDIALYVKGLLSNTQNVKIQFIGRKYDLCDVMVIEKIVNIQKEETGRKSNGKAVNHFQNFINEHLPMFDVITLEPVPEDCWILLISLLYYNVKANRDITNIVYSIILSYVMLGPVSEKIGVIKRSNFSVSHGVIHKESIETANKNKTNLTSEQCSNAASSVMDLFYVQEGKLKDKFDRDALHTLAEFQYCLQFINYLNRLCGEKIKRTAYHKSINCTFIYNLFVALEDETSPKDYIRNLLNCGPVFSYFIIILDTYFECLSLVK